MSLNLHSGGELVPFEMLRQMQTPAATPTHVPIPHHHLVQLVRSTLSMYGHEVVEEHHAIDHEGMRYFGLMTLRSEYSDYSDTLGLRNSHDKRFPIGVGFGSRVFVCSNLAFVADHVIRRKHTQNAKRELPGLLMEIIEPLAFQREAQHKKLLTYKERELSDAEADHTILDLYRQDVIGVQAIGHVLKAFEEPPHDWGNRTAWRLFNAATFALAGKVAENPRITERLHKVIDGTLQ